MIHSQINQTNRPLDWGGSKALKVYVSRPKPQSVMPQGQEYETRDN